MIATDADKSTSAPIIPGESECNSPPACVLTIQNNLFDVLGLFIALGISSAIFDLAKFNMAQLCFYSIVHMNIVKFHSRKVSKKTY